MGPGVTVLGRRDGEPVLVATTFRTPAEAVQIANNTRYGLAASIWTRDLSRAHRLAERVEAGTVWINCWMLRDLRTPFGGVKQSGIGREGSRHGMDEYVEMKYVCLSGIDK